MLHFRARGCTLAAGMADDFRLVDAARPRPIDGDGNPVPPEADRQILQNI
ncbi:MAG: hypothetical protein AB7G25_04895 [Sphingomonadaceae bacterium]